MSDCQTCPVERDCHYPYKPCDCVHQRKFWSHDRRERHEALKIAGNAPQQAAKADWDDVDSYGPSG